MAKIQTLKINGEVVYPRTIKQAIVDLQGTPTIITNDGSGGDSVAIKLTDNGSYQRTFHIDMVGVYTGGAVIQRIGSLIIECFDEGSDGICHGYYYGDAMSDILTEVAVYQDDQDSDIFYLMLTHESDLDSVTFAISPTDGGEVDAIITNAADNHTKVEDATISPVGKVFVETNSVSAGDAVTISSLTPNVLHKYIGGALSSLTVTALDSPASAVTVNEYMIECELGASSTISFPATLKWFGGSIPTIEAGIWQFSIVDDCIVAGMFKVSS